MDNQLCNSTFQYASLMNFDQLAIRTECRAYSGCQAGRTGCFRSLTPAWPGVRSASRGDDPSGHSGRGLERELEQRSGRTLTELSIDDNKGFKAADDSACSIYVAKGGDVITWSIQTMNPATLPDLCGITEQLAQLSQERVN